ncbi:hypothetical protein [Sphingomonas sp. RS2018]
MSRMLLAGAALLALTAAAPAERVIHAGQPVAATVAGVPVRLLVDPGAPSILMVDAATAGRAKLKPGPFAMRWMVGPVIVPARTAVVRVDSGGGVEKRRIGWTERAYADGVDGSVGPGGLKQDVVRIVLRAPRAGEHESMLPMVDGGGLFGGAAGLFGQVTIDGAPVRIRFDLRRRTNMTSAGAAVTLARVYDGLLAKEVHEGEVVFGVKRPMRVMTLARPLTIGTLALRTIDVRTSDFGNANGIATERAEPDPDEIVVTAKGKRNRDRDRISIGTDTLAACSSIVFDKRAKVIRLSCL